MRSPAFPETICEIVYQGQNTRNCQFPLACDGRSHKPQEDAHWALAQKLAQQITAGEVWLPDLGYAISLETALAIGTSTGVYWADCIGVDLERKLAGCNAFIAEAKEGNLDLNIAYKIRGGDYYNKGDYDRAISDYDQAIRLAPANADALAYMNRGASYYWKGDYYRAIADLDQAIKLDPRDASAYANRGIGFEAMGNRERATSDFRTALPILFPTTP